MSRRLTYLGLALVLAACSEAQRPPTEPSPPPTNTAASAAGSASMPPTDPGPGPGPKPATDSVVAFTAGAPVSPGAGLRRWLDDQAASGRKTVRLPVLLALESYGAIRHAGARVGGAADALEISVDDTRLGISLQDRVRGKFTAGAPTGAAWLEGEWLPDSTTLAITKFGGVIADADVAAATHAEVER